MMTDEVAFSDESDDFWGKKICVIKYAYNTMYVYFIIENCYRRNRTSPAAAVYAINGARWLFELDVYIFIK